MATEKKSDKDWDQTYLPIIKLLTGKKGLTIKSASEVDKKKVDYCRGKDVVQWLLTHDSALKRRCQKALDETLDGACPADDADVVNLCTPLLQKGFFVQAVYTPIIEKKSESGEKKTRKWPDRVTRRRTTTDTQFDPEGFYIIMYEGSQAWRNLMLAGVVTCIILGCLFPVWPIWARLAAWYLALAFSTLYLCLEFTRMGCFAAGWLVGVEFWILPNFNDEECGLVESFKPIYSFERRRDGWMMLASRALIIAIAYAGLEELSKTHSLSDIEDFVKGSYQDIIEWGENRVMMLEGPGQRMALPSLQELEAEEAAEAAKGEGTEGSNFGDDGEEVEKEEL